MPATATQEDSVPTYRQLQDEARAYYALCAEAERLGIATSLDDPATPQTVDALRAAVAEAQGRCPTAEDGGLPCAECGQIAYPTDYACACSR